MLLPAPFRVRAACTCEEAAEADVLWRVDVPLVTADAPGRPTLGGRVSGQPRGYFWMPSCLVRLPIRAAVKVQVVEALIVGEAAGEVLVRKRDEIAD